jgi:hypothetical protein
LRGVGSGDVYWCDGGVSASSKVDVFSDGADCVASLAEFTQLGDVVLLILRLSRVFEKLPGDSSLLHSLRDWKYVPLAP